MCEVVYHYMGLLMGQNYYILHNIHCTLSCGADLYVLKVLTNLLSLQTILDKTA